MILHSPAYEDGTDSEFRNVGNWNSDAGELPKKEQITGRHSFVVTRGLWGSSWLRYGSWCLKFGVARQISAEAPIRNNKTVCPHS